MEKPLLSTLSSQDRQAIIALIERIITENDDDIKRLTLFGSKARGDDLQEPDIDLLMVAETDAWPLRQRILRLGARLSLEHDVLFNLYVISHERWLWMKRVRHPLYRNIVADGLDLVVEGEFQYQFLSITEVSEKQTS